MEITSPKVAPARGLLHQKMSMEHFDLIRIAPSDALKPFVENYWIIVWDRGDAPAYTQENLPHPSQHMVIDPLGQSGLFGIQTGKFTYTLENSGRIFGVKFWPGACHTFLNQSASVLTDSFLPIENAFDASTQELEQSLLDQNDPSGMGRLVEGLLQTKEPILCDKAIEAREFVALIAQTSEIVSLAQLAKSTGKNTRYLQRLFETYIGINPKWVIDRYRMLDAVDALNRGDQISLTSLAHDLGYFDQAHFTKMFSQLTGHPPSHYLNRSLDSRS